jgi:uncharacterized protein (TIGR03435 family)
LKNESPSPKIKDVFLALIVAFLAGFVWCQNEFEVASVKLEPHNGALTRDAVLMNIPVMRGGPGTNSPARIHYAHVTLKRLITKAYGVHSDQVLGPAWLTSEKYTVDATLPEHASEEQFEEMLQNLLAQRFRLIFQRGERDFAVYNLVLASGGPKLKVSAVEAGSDLESDPTPLPTYRKLDREGCPVVDEGFHGAVGSVGADNCMIVRGYSMADLIKMLEMMWLSRPARILQIFRKRMWLIEQD